MLKCYTYYYYLFMLLPVACICPIKILNLGFSIYSILQLQAQLSYHTDVARSSL